MGAVYSSERQWSETNELGESNTSTEDSLGGLFSAPAARHRDEFAGLGPIQAAHLSTRKAAQAAKQASTSPRNDSPEENSVEVILRERGYPLAGRQCHIRPHCLVGRQDRHSSSPMRRWMKLASGWGFLLSPTSRREKTPERFGSGPRAR